MGRFKFGEQVFQNSNTQCSNIPLAQATVWMSLVYGLELYETHWFTPVDPEL